MLGVEHHVLDAVAQDHFGVDAPAGVHGEQRNVLFHVHQQAIHRLAAGLAAGHVVALVGEGVTRHHVAPAKQVQVELLDADVDQLAR